ncbi:MAG: NTP transferase domain-containing protein [Clostridia bacterium]|nr:NTP transferase domain-containing protein [Clostridia bacterium]
MLGVIMAGGQGERLRPLTCTLPKPMTLIGGQPILAHTLGLLKKHGITEAAVTLGYLPSVIMDAFGDEFDGVALHYFTERRPMGTAGGVKLCRDFLKETFIVLSGDGITDVDLTKALSFHHEKHALATMVLTRVQNPTEYGLVHTDEDGRILSFTEKPAWKKVDGDTANTGIYILEPEILDFIPDGEAYDFGKQLFPELVRQNLAVFGFESDAYWCDVGNLDAYLCANIDVLNGNLTTFSLPENGIIRMPGAIVDERSRIEGPVFIGAGAHIMKNTFIGAGSVIGGGAIVMEGASVKRSVIYPGSRIGENVQLRGCVLAPHAFISNGASIFEGCVIGEKTHVGEGCVIDSGAKIWPGKVISEGRRISQSIVWGQKSRDDFSGLSIRIKTPTEAVSAAEACAWKLNAPVSLVARSASQVAANQARAFSAGLIAEGVHVYDMGDATLPLLMCAMRESCADGGYYVTGDSVTPIRKNALPVSDSEKRMIRAALSRQDAPLSYTSFTSRLENAGRFDLVYFKHLESAVTSPLRRFKAAVHSNREQLLYYAENAFRRLNYVCRAEWEEELMELSEDEIGVFLSDDGKTAAFSQTNKRLADAENEMLIAWALLEREEKIIYAPPCATHALDEIAKAYGASVQYFSDERALWEQLSKSSALQFFARTDGIYLSLLVMDVLSSKNTHLDEILRRFPSVYRANFSIPLPDEKRAGMLKRIKTRAPGEYECEEWFYHNQAGCAWIQPDEAKPVLSVVSEARDMETAQEICDVFSGLFLDSLNEQ